MLKCWNSEQKATKGVGEGARWMSVDCRAHMGQAGRDGRAGCGTGGTAAPPARLATASLSGGFPPPRSSESENRKLVDA